MSISGTPSISASVMAAMQAAGAQMDAAAASIGSGDLNDLVDASMAMSTAKLSMGVAVQLSRVSDEMSASTLDMLV